MRRACWTRFCEHRQNGKEDSALTRKKRPDPVWRSFSAEEARRQLETVIHCGRYGELFGFEDDTDELFLETSEPRPD